MRRWAAAGSVIFLFVFCFFLFFLFGGLCIVVVCYVHSIYSCAFLCCIFFFPRNASGSAGVTVLTTETGGTGPVVIWSVNDDEIAMIGALKVGDPDEPENVEYSAGGEEINGEYTTTAADGDSDVPPGASTELSPRVPLQSAPTMNELVPSPASSGGGGSPNRSDPPLAKQPSPRLLSVNGGQSPHSLSKSGSFVSKSRSSLLDSPRSPKGPPLSPVMSSAPTPQVTWSRLFFFVFVFVIVIVFAFHPLQCKVILFFVCQSNLPIISI
jgi:hypothetical protein